MEELRTIMKTLTVADLWAVISVGYFADAKRGVYHLTFKFGVAV